MPDLFDRLETERATTKTGGDLFDRLPPNAFRIGKKAAAPTLAPSMMPFGESDPIAAIARSLKPDAKPAGRPASSFGRDLIDQAVGAAPTVAPRPISEWIDSGRPQQTLKAPPPPTVLDHIGGALKAAPYDLASGLGGIERSIIDNLNDNPLTDILHKKGRRSILDPIANYLKAAQDRTTDDADAAYGGEPESYVGKNLKVGLRSAPSSLIALGFAAMGAPQAGVALLAGQTGGAAYKQGKDAGLSTEQSTLFGIEQGSVEYLTEMVPALKYFNDTKVGSTFGRKLMNNLATELPGEQLATAMQDFNEWANLRPETSIMDYVRARPEAALSTAIATTVGSSLAVSAEHGLGRLADRGAGIEPPPIAPGVRETAATQAAVLTPEDEASPIPNAIIAAGKATVAAATSTAAADEILTQGNAPTVGKRVTVRMPDGSQDNGIVTDAFVTEAGAAGSAAGIKIRLDDGTLINEHLDILAEAGVSILPETSPLAEADAIDAQLQAMADAPAIVATAPTPSPAPLPAATGATPVTNGREVTESLFPGVNVTSNYRDPNHALSKANPNSWHTKSHGAVDVAPINGMTFEQYVERYRDAGYAIIEAKNEVGAGRSAWATGDHWHVVIGKNGSGGVAPSTASDAPVIGAVETVEAPLAPAETALIPSVFGADDGGSAKPVTIESADDLQSVGQRVAEPTEAQKEAGNYRKAHVNVQGLDIAIENPKGSTRSGTDADGKPWSVEMPDAYGYLKRTTGADGDQVDVYVGPQPDAPSVFVVDQADADTGSFDEHKALVGYASQADALNAYNAAFSDGRGPDRTADVTEMSMPAFKEWLKGDTTKPAAQEHPGLVIKSLQTGKETIMQPRGTVAPAPSTATASATVADMPSGKSIIVRDASPEQLAAIRTAIPNALPLEPKSGGVVYSVKYRAQIDTALKETTIEPVAREGRKAGEDRTDSPASPANSGDGAKAIRLYRGEAPVGSLENADMVAAERGLWFTRDPKIARSFATDKGTVYSIDIPESEMDAAATKYRAMSNGEEYMLTPEWAAQKTKLSPEPATPTSPDGATLAAVAGSNVAAANSLTAKRFGDFYEFFDDDAKAVAKTLNIALTTRGKNNTPMAGVPVWSLDQNRAKLEAAGFTVEIAGADQPVSNRDELPVKPSGYGSKNKIITTEAYAEIKAKLKAKLSGAQLNMGVDPELLSLGTQAAIFHIESGARKFADFAKAISKDLEVSIPELKRYLRSWYVGAQAALEDAGEDVSDMDGPGAVRAAIAMIEDADSTFAAIDGKETPQDAKPAAPSQPRSDDRNGSEGPRTQDLSAIEGERDAEGGADRPGRDGDRSVRDGAQRRSGQSDGPSAEPDTGGEGERSDAGAKRSGKRSDSVGDRVSARRSDTGRGTDYLAPKGSLKREGSWLKTAERNLDIIELVNSIEADKRAPTVAEQSELAKFTGWGAGEIANNIFKPNMIDRTGGQPRMKVDTWERGEWPDLRRRAADLLTGDNLATALRSTQYAHYTSEDVIRSMWAAVERMGFKGGRVIEPGAGIGLFMAAAPKEIAAASQYLGVEMDGFTAKVGQLLLPQSTMRAEDFTRLQLPNEFFDLAIGNPPFSSSKVLDDPAYRKHRLSLHDYFFAKSIDKVRPGGLMVFVTSRYTMDKQDDKGRAYIEERANLLGAIRLPQTAFKQNAGTEVVTDILFFQRRPSDQVGHGGEKWGALDAIKGGPADGKLINGYFVAHPEMVLGEHDVQRSQFSASDYTVKASATDIAELLATAVAKLPRNIYSKAVAEPAAAVQVKTLEADLRPAAAKEGGLYVGDDGKVFVRENGVGVRVEKIDDKLTADNVAWLKSYAGVRDALKTAQRDQLNDGDWEASLKALNKSYDAFVKKHGAIQAHTISERTFVDDDGNETVRAYKRFKNQKLLNLDVEYPLLLTLETVKDGGVVAKGPFLAGRSLNRPLSRVVESAQDALAVTLDDLGRFDLAYAAALAKKTPEAIIEALGDGIYLSPAGEGVWQTSDEYLSGDVIKKLNEAKAAADQDDRYGRNVDALIKVQPNPLGPADITVKIGSGWIPNEITKQFVRDEVDIDPTTLAYEVTTAEWAMEMQGSRVARRTAAATEYGTADQSPQEILLKVLNNQTIKITRKMENGGTYVDPEATALANQKAKELSDRFSAWVWEDGPRAAELTEIYNNRFNNLAPRAFDGSHMTMPGLSARYKLFGHQKRAIWRVIQTGNTYLAHAVGAGKTLEMIVAGMEQRRIGLIRKPMYVVPNHMLTQFASEFMEAYPAANIMIADERNFHTDNRKRFMAQASMNDPDAIIITHSSLIKIDLRDDSRKIVLDRMIEELTAALSTSDSRYTVKKIEKQIEALTSRFGGQTGGTKDKALTFEEMGVDQLIIDEAHEFRKLDFATNRSIKGIDAKGSQRALDLYIKTRFLAAQNPGRSLIMASGTPVTNTMAEIFTVMRYMDEPGLEADGLRAFDAWANMFGEVAAGYEQNAAGGYDVVERFAKFVNVPELMSRVRTFMDVLTSDQLGDLVVRPAVRGGVPENVVSPPIAALRTFMDEVLLLRIAATRAWKPSKDQPNNPDPIIAINGDALLASIDMRFIDPTLPNDPGSKLNEMIDKIVAKHADIRDIEYTDPKTGNREMVKGGTQIVFSAVGFGEAAQRNRGFDLRSHLEKRLIEGGVKKSEIAWMGDANSHAKKEAVFKDMRAGRIRVLIGSPKNMGTGVNVQNRLAALHYLSPPWYPSDVEQPHGRIVRQGNWNSVVDLFWYATKGTYDSTAWGMVSRKAKFIEQALSGDNSVRKIEDVSEVSQYEMAAAMAAGDERVMAVAGLNGEIARLSRLRGAHAQTQRDLTYSLRDVETYAMPRAKRVVAETKSAVAARDGNAPFSMKIDGKTFDKQSEAGEALLAKALETTEPGPLGSFQGHAISRMTFANRDYVGVKLGDLELTVVKYNDLADQSAQGLAAKIANSVARLPSDLREAERELAELDTQLTAIKRKVGAPFPQAAALADKTAELAQLQGEMASESKTADLAAAALLEAAEATKTANGPKQSRIEPTDSAAPQGPVDIAAARTDLSAELDRLGVSDAVKLEVVGLIDENPTVAGSYWNRIITVALQANQDTKVTLHHEVVHFLREAEAFRPAEWRSLETAALADKVAMAAIRARYPDLDESRQVEEAVADRVARWTNGDTERPFIAKTFERLLDILRALGQALRGNGFTTAQSVMAAIDSGEIGGRASQNNTDVELGRSSDAKETSNKMSRTDQSRWVAEFMNELAAVDELFRYPTSPSTGLTGAFADIAPDVRYFGAINENSDVEGSAFQEALKESGADRVTIFSIKGVRRFFVYEKDDDVWLDVSKLREGEGGSAIYSAVAEYAFNTGKIFIGDPAGLSDVALRRRTDAMLSSALKRGTTDHLKPHPRQVQGSNLLGVPPLVWTTSDSLGNIQSMIDVSVASLISEVPEIEQATFDFASGEFRYTDGRKISDVDLERAAAAARGDRAASIGRNSLKRGILHKSLLRAVRGERPGLLELVLRQPGQLVGQSLQRTFYSRTAAPSVPSPFERVAEPARETDETEASAVDLVNTLSENDPSTVAGGSRFDRFRTAMQDRMLPMLRIQQTIEAATGEPLAESENPYIGEELMSGRIGSALETLADGMVEPLFGAMKAEGITSAELESYLYARHAPERNAHIAEINEEFAVDEGSGMTDAEAAQIMEAVAESGKEDGLVRLAKRVDALTGFSVDTRVEAGLLSKQEALAWRKSFDFYVPLRGRGDLDAETTNPARPMKGSGISVKGAESRRAFGRKSRAGDILAYAIMAAEEAIIRAETNRVGQQFLDLAQANPDPDFWKIDKITRKAMWDKASKSVVYENQRRITADDAPFTVTAKVEGVEHRITMNRDNQAAVRVADAMRNLSAQQLQPFVKYVGMFTRTFSRLNTTLNPEFVITNAMRDIQAAGVNLQQYDMKGLVKGTIRDWRKALTASKDGDGEWSKHRREFEAAGGKMYFLGLSDLTTIKDRIEALAKRGDKASLKTAAVKAFEVIGRINDRVENAVRLSAFANARRLGMSETQAASLARNVTVNFTRRGQYGPVMNSLYAFFNAGVQGSTTLIRAATRSKKVRAALVGFVVAGFLTDMLNRWGGDDDEDGESYWDKVPAYEKAKNLIIMLPGMKDKAVKLPLGLGLNAFFSLGRNLSEIMHGRSALDTGWEAVTTTVDAFNPLGSGSLLTTLLPTFLDPVAELAVNKNFADKPIQPEQKPYGEEVPTSELYFASVSTVSKNVASWLNSVTGGDEVIPGAVSVSPEVMDYTAAFVTGGAGRFVSTLAGLATAPFDYERELTIKDMPFARKIVGEKPVWLDKSLFYDRIKQVEQTIEHAESYEELGNDEQFRAYVKNNEKVAGLEGDAKAAQKEMRGIRKARRENERAHDLGEIEDAEYKAEVTVQKDAESLVVAEFNTAWNKAMGAD